MGGWHTPIRAYELESMGKGISIDFHVEAQIRNEGEYKSGLGSANCRVTGEGLKPLTVFGFDLCDIPLDEVQVLIDLLARWDDKYSY